MLPAGHIADTPSTYYPCVCAQCTRLNLLGVNLLNDLAVTMESAYGQAELLHAIHDEHTRYWAVQVIPFVCRWEYYGILLDFNYAFSSPNLRRKLLVEDKYIDVIVKLLLTTPAEQHVHVCRTIFSILTHGRLASCLCSQSKHSCTDMVSNYLSSITNVTKHPATIESTGACCLRDGPILNGDEFTIEYMNESGERILLHTNRSVLRNFSAYFATLFDGPYAERDSTRLTFTTETYGAMIYWNYIIL
jgi:hypothetical protein